MMYRNSFFTAWAVATWGFIFPAMSVAESYSLTTLVTFNGPNGAIPFAGLISDADGNMYGTTNGGGLGAINQVGTVYKLSAGTHTLTTLHSFDGEDGKGAAGGLAMDANGNLYGTTRTGFYNNGEVFQIAHGTNAMNVLVDFIGSNGHTPYASLTTGPDGNIYGTTTQGGANHWFTSLGDGTVFKVDANTHALTTLYSFGTDGNDGSRPYGGVAFDGNGNIYGTTTYGGADFRGIVWEISADTHAMTILNTFSGADGANPYGDLFIDSAGNIFGTTNGGGAYNNGTIFRIAADTHEFTTLYSFAGSDGANPYAGLISDEHGNLFGTTTRGGENDDGTVFKFSLATQSLTTLATFDGTNGRLPDGKLLIDAEGNLFGTTSQGGASNQGTVFELVHVVPETSSFVLVALGVIAFAYPSVKRSRCNAK